MGIINHQNSWVGTFNEKTKNEKNPLLRNKTREQF